MERKGVAAGAAFDSVVEENMRLMEGVVMGRGQVGGEGISWGMKWVEKSVVVAVRGGASSEGKEPPLCQHMSPSLSSGG